MKKRITEQEYRKKKLNYTTVSNFYNRKTGEWEYEVTKYGPSCYTKTDNNGKLWVKKYYKGSSFQADKRYGNRKIRYYKGIIKNGSYCFKIYNAEWNYH